MNKDTTLKRTPAGHTIRVIAAVLMLAALAQIVNFWQGGAGHAQLTAFLSFLFGPDPEPSGALSGLTAFAQKLLYFWRCVGGTLFWSWIAIGVMRLGLALARVQEIGLEAYRHEEQAKHFEMERRLRRKLARDRRRALSAAPRAQERSDTRSSSDAFVVGLVLGAFFF